MTAKASKWSGLSESERFDMKVFKARPDECWPWMAGTDKRGYGRFRSTEGPTWAHLFALERKLGRKLLPGMVTLHSCDNNPCCNEAHLSEGPQKQNIRDMFERGRARPGGRSVPGLKRLDAVDQARGRRQNESPAARPQEDQS